MARNEKSLAVESMHRLLKHFNDAIEGDAMSDEIFEIMDIWKNREHFTELDLNAALTKIRQIRAGNFDLTVGWKPLGRRGFTTKGL